MGSELDSKAYGKLYRIKNASRLRFYRKKHAKQLKQDKKLWYQKNRIRILKAIKNASPLIKACRRIAHKKYQQLTKQRQYNKNYGKIYYRKHKKEINTKSNKWYRHTVKHNPNQILNSSLKTKFGITLEGYNSLLQQQHNQCAICGLSAKNSLRLYRQRLSVDHCHKSNIVRGLLCRMCNVGLGAFKDNIDLFRGVINYLERYK